MGKINCWEFMKCGREPGGSKEIELGICSASVEHSSDGINEGLNGGRACWALSGTCCGGEVQGTFASKIDNCGKCDFYKLVAKDQGNAFQNTGKIRRALEVSKLKVNCWEYKKCGREVGGVKSSELGICSASVETITDGINRGINGGRACWALSGTFCEGKAQGVFAIKYGNCKECSFYKMVQKDEGDTFQGVREIRRALMLSQVGDETSVTLL